MTNSTRPINIPANSLMVFSKGKLIFLFFTSMLVGISFFFFGYLLGYQIGKQHMISSIKKELKYQRGLKYADKKRLQWIDKPKIVKKPNKHDYLVHIGLFSNVDHATAAWNDVDDYSQLKKEQAILEVHINDQIFYQVVAGRFAQKSQAEIFSEIIKARSNKNLLPIIQKTNKLSQKTKDK